MRNTALRYLIHELGIRKQYFDNHELLATEAVERTWFDKCMILVSYIQFLESELEIIVEKYDNDLTTAADMADDIEALLKEKDHETD